VQQEKDLVEAARRGNGDAFSQLYEDYFDRVYRYIIFRVGSQEEAEDITEEVFLKVWQNIASFKWRGVPFSSWLFRIAHNQVVDHLRKRERRKGVPLDEVAVADDVDLDASLDFQLSVEKLVAAMGRLTDAQRRTLALRFAAGLSLSETAQAMGKSEGAIKALQHNALAALRIVMSAEAGG